MTEFVDGAWRFAARDLGAQNPLVPTPFDVANGVFFAVAVVLLVIAVIVLIRVADRLSGKQSLLWFLLILAVPLIGPIVWLSVGARRHGARRAPEADPAEHAESAEPPA